MFASSAKANVMKFCRMYNQGVIHHGALPISFRIPYWYNFITSIGLIGRTEEELRLYIFFRGPHKDALCNSWAELSRYTYLLLIYVSGTRINLHLRNDANTKRKGIPADRIEIRVISWSQTRDMEWDSAKKSGNYYTSARVEFLIGSAGGFFY